jgi:hypothetical protein
MKVENNALTALVEYAGDQPPASLPPEARFHPDDLVAEGELVSREGSPS